MKAIYKREMHAYFTSPVAYCVVGFFLALTGLYFWNINLTYKNIEFSNTLDGLSSFLVYFVPVITMKLLSEEKRNGTEVLLRTSPVKIWKIVVGKYFAAFTLFMILVLCTVICPIIMSAYINEEGVFPWAMTIGSYIGFILLGAAYIAVGTLVSSLTENQSVAAVGGVVALLLLTFMESLGTQIGGVIGSVMVWVSLSSRYGDFATGLFNLTSIFYYISFTVVVLFITTVNIERKRWN